MKIEKIILLVQTGNEHLFYISSAWRKKTEQVKKLDNNECQLCKSIGKYGKADMVHHINHLKDRPELALSIWEDEAHTKRNLISVCDKCHKTICHPEMLKPFKSSAKVPLTVERWD